MFSYDLPETRRNDRAQLWRALRARKLGLLQLSMWVWPHEVEEAIATELSAAIHPSASIVFLHADICRPDLLVEIEAAGATERRREH